MERSEKGAGECARGTVAYQRLLSGAKLKISAFCNLVVDFGRSGG